MWSRSACPLPAQSPTTLISSPPFPGQAAGHENGVDDTERDEEREVEVPSDEPQDASGHGEAHDEAGCRNNHELPLESRSSHMFTVIIMSGTRFGVTGCLEGAAQVSEAVVYLG